jgi:hypothetical protein
MDLSDSIVPKSDQINAEDLLSGAVTVTVTGVNKGNAEQPVNIELAEFPGRAFRPSKTVRRVLVAAWGKDSSAYIGRRLTIFRDPHVKWAGEEVGGIRVSHLSHIDKPLTVSLTETRGKRKPTTVQPLTESSTDPASALKDTGHAGDVEPSIEDVSECTDVATLRAWWKVSGPTKRALIEARTTELNTPPEPMESLLDGDS